MTSLPTRAELALHYTAFERREKRRHQIVIVLFIGALFADLLLARRVEEASAEWISWCVLIAAFAVVLAVALGAKGRARAAGVSCPSCGAAFTHRFARQVVVATGSCTTCGARVAHDAVDVRDASEHIPEVASTPTHGAVGPRWMTLLLGASLGFAAHVLITNPDQASLAPAVGVTVDQAAARIAASRGRPSVVLLYGTRCQPTCRVLADFAAMVRRHPDVDVQAFSADEHSASALPALLWRHDANFAPMYLRRWPNGALDKSMAPLGIRIGTTWTPHLIAVRDADGRVVVQGQAVQSVAPFERAIDSLRRASGTR